MFLIFLNHFDTLMLKIIFFLKNIILMYFNTKNSLKNNNNDTFFQIGADKAAKTWY